MAKLTHDQIEQLKQTHAQVKQSNNPAQIEKVEYQAKQMKGQVYA